MRNQLRLVGVLVLAASAMGGGCSRQDTDAVGTTASPLTDTSGIANAEIALKDVYDGGYCATVTITNTAGTAAITSWEVAVDLKTATSDNSWSSKRTGRTGVVKFAPETWNSSIGVGAKTSFGFCAVRSNKDVVPAVITALTVRGGGTPAAGGAPGAGGMPATGGTTTDIAGAPGTGGATTEMGGAPAAGGTTADIAGAPGTGGATTEMGGAPAAGGTTADIAGAPGAGGTNATGGVPATGGTTSIGVDAAISLDSDWGAGYCA